MKIEIAPYNPAWQHLFEQEKRLIHQALDPLQKIYVEHIGSTSVEQLHAKPIVDIMVGLEDFSRVDETCLDPMAKIGFVYLPQYNEGMPFRRLFIRGEEKGFRTCHVHMTQYQNAFWTRHLFFRDYLRKHPETRLEYQNLKYKLAQREWSSGNEYAQAKTSFIRAIEAKMEA